MLQTFNLNEINIGIWNSMGSDGVCMGVKTGLTLNILITLFLDWLEQWQ